MMKSIVLDGFAVNPGDMSWDFLSEFGPYTVYDQTSQDQVAERIGDADIVMTNRLKINDEVLDKCPNLKFVSALGTGYDMIDVPACRARGVEVCNIPGYSTISVSQHAFTLLLSLATDIGGYRRAVRDGRWTGQPDFRYQTIAFTELYGKTVGIYGCGAIGGRFASLCAAFGMRVLAYRRSAPLGVQGDLEFVSVERLLAESDFLSLHCPLTEETRGLVNRDFLAKMKRGAYLINTSRGAVVDEEALYEALTTGRLAGAGLDVMVKEPPLPDNPLLTLDNCIITPHCAWTALETRHRLVDILAANIRSFIKNGEGINRVL
ncbi:MAG: D-2-hydroxyacid dehydrogenase [Ruminococcaceae bacterium]|nr:D-2-hydroxyacid dehydrogenase [Oscillospiraceae bacterium]